MNLGLSNKLQKIVPSLLRRSFSTKLQLTLTTVEMGRLKVMKQELTENLLFESNLKPAISQDILLSFIMTPLISLLSCRLVIISQNKINLLVVKFFVQFFAGKILKGVITDAAVGLSQLYFKKL